MTVINGTMQSSLRIRRPRAKPTTDWVELIDHELAAVPQRILAETGGILNLRFTDRVRTFIRRETGTDLPHRGAIQQVIERQLITPLLRLSYSGQLSAGKTLIVKVDEQGKRLLFDYHRTPPTPRPALL
jgi:hypothetical protein